MSPQAERLTFDELMWPQPTTRRQSLEVEREDRLALAAAPTNFECSNWGLAAIWILNGVLLTVIGIAAVYITSWFIL